MSTYFHYDFTKAGVFDVSNGTSTITINSTPHKVEVCICDECKKIQAAKKKKEEEEKAKKAAAAAAVTYVYHGHSCCHCSCH